MRNTELPKFAGAVVPIMEETFIQALQSGVLPNKTKKDKQDLVLKSSKTYDGYSYVFNVGKDFLLHRVNSDNNSELVMAGLYASKKSWEKMIEDGSFTLMASYQFFISNISILKKIMSDLGLNQFDDKYQFFEEDMQKYDFGLKADLNSIFEASKHYDSFIELGSDFFHKHQIGTKEVISHTNTDAGITAFILYERDTETGDIRIIEELEENVDEKFERETIVIGEYPEIVKHYVETAEPSVIIKNGNISKNDNPHIILITHFNAYGLEKEYNIKRPLPYDISNLNSVMDYLVFDNINWLYTLGMWSSKARWTKNDKNEYYPAFTDDLLAGYKRGTPIVYDSKDLGHISTYDETSAMHNLPVDGRIAPEWLELVKKSLNFLTVNREKLPVCDVNEEQIHAVKEKLANQN